MKDSFILGFINKAAEYNLVKEVALDIYKKAKEDEKSTFLSRYMALKGTRGAYRGEHPFLSNADSGSGLYSSTKAKGRKEVFEKGQKHTKEDSVGQHAMRYGKNNAPITAIGGGLVGSLHGSQMHGGKGALIGALLGTLGGGAIGMGGGSAYGAIHSLLHKHRGKDDNEFAADRLSKHPILHSLPFGDVISAARK